MSLVDPFGRQALHELLVTACVAQRANQMPAAADVAVKLHDCCLTHGHKPRSPLRRLTMVPCDHLPNNFPWQAGRINCTGTIATLRLADSININK